MNTHNPGRRVRRTDSTMNTFILMTGSRNERFRPRLEWGLETVLKLLPVFPIGPSKLITLIHGDAPGADKECAEIVQEWGWEVAPYPAEWRNPDGSTNYGAGYARNQEMVDVCMQIIRSGTNSQVAAVAFPKGYKEKSGTIDCLLRIRKSRIIPLLVVPEWDIYTNMSQQETYQEELFA